MAIDPGSQHRNREAWRTAVMAIDPGSQQGIEKQRRTAVMAIDPGSQQASREAGDRCSSHGDRPRITARNRESGEQQSWRSTPDHSKEQRSMENSSHGDRPRITARTREAWRTAVMAIDPGSQQGTEKHGEQQSWRSTPDHSKEQRSSGVDSSHGDRFQFSSMVTKAGEQQSWRSTPDHSIGTEKHGEQQSWRSTPDHSKEREAWRTAVMAIDPGSQQGTREAWSNSSHGDRPRITARNREAWRTAVMAIDPGSQQGTEKQGEQQSWRSTPDHSKEQRTIDSSHGDRGSQQGIQRSIENSSHGDRPRITAR